MTTQKKIKEIKDGIGYEVKDAAICAYIDIVGKEHANTEGFEDSYCGEFASDEEFAQDIAESTGAIPKDQPWPLYCIDWEHAARELMYDYSEWNGYYFRNY